VGLALGESRATVRYHQRMRDGNLGREELDDTKTFRAKAPKVGNWRSGAFSSFRYFSRSVSFEFCCLVALSSIVSGFSNV